MTEQLLTTEDEVYLKLKYGINFAAWKDGAELNMNLDPKLIEFLRENGFVPMTFKGHIVMCYRIRPSYSPMDPIDFRHCEEWRLLVCLKEYENIVDETSAKIDEVVEKIRNDQL